MVAIYRYVSKKKQKNHWFGQKRGVSKRAVSLMYLITNLRISWLELLEVIDWEPYNKDCLFNDKTMLQSKQRFKSDCHNVCTEQINTITLSSNHDKRLQTFDKSTTYTYGTMHLKYAKVRC